MKSPRLSLTLIVVFLVPSAAPLFAAKANETPAKLFEKYDANKNGKIDADEMAKVRADFAAKPKGGIAKLDKDGDRKLSDAEIAALVPSGKTRSDADREEKKARRSERKKPAGGASESGTK